MKNIKDWRLKILVPCLSAVSATAIVVPAVVCSIPSKIVTTKYYATNNIVKMSQDNIGVFDNMLSLKKAIDKNNYVIELSAKAEVGAVEESGSDKVPVNFNVKLQDSCTIAADGKTLLFKLHIDKPNLPKNLYRITIRFFIKCKEQKTNKVVWSQTVKKIRFKLQWS